MSLYHGEEYQSLMDYWFNKAQDLIDDYIESYLNAEATAEELDKINMVRHSHALTYKEKRHKRGRGVWAR
jgi:hypothetical protein